MSNFSIRFALALVAGGTLALISGGAASAAPFTAGNLVVMQVNNSQTGSGAITLVEYTTAGAPVGNAIAIDPGASTGATMSLTRNNAMHLHRSQNGQYLSFGAYGQAPSATDPATLSGSVAPRVVGIVDPSGAVDLSTRLTDAFNPGPTNPNTIRAAVVGNDGISIWVAGDNAGDTTTSGGIRYTTRSSSTTTNISRTQSNGGSPTSDNVRDLNIFDGQLFDSSGSSASIGRNVFRVGTGLPTNGAQSITPVASVTNSVTSFYFVDADNTPGVDTLFTVAGDLRMYSLVGSSWVARGTLSGGVNALDQVIAQRNSDGSLMVFAGSAGAVVSLNIPSPLSPSLNIGTGFAFNTVLTAPEGSVLGGIEFSPVPAPGVAGLLAMGGAFASRRRR
jgi:hypothetical protein